MVKYVSNTRHYNIEETKYNDLNNEGLFNKVIIEIYSSNFLKILSIITKLSKQLYKKSSHTQEKWVKMKGYLIMLILIYHIFGGKLYDSN